MGFTGYKLKYKLVVFESMPDLADSSAAFAKNFEITLFISSVRTRFLRFDEIDRIVNKTLSMYSQRELKTIPPFDQIEPTIDHVGTVIYELIRRDLMRIDTSLERLEVGISPVRTFILNETKVKDRLMVGEKRLKISNLIVENMISQSVAEMVSNIEKKQKEEVVLPEDLPDFPESEEIPFHITAQLQPQIEEITDASKITNDGPEQREETLNVQSEEVKTDCVVGLSSYEKTEPPMEKEKGFFRKAKEKDRKRFSFHFLSWDGSPELTLETRPAPWYQLLIGIIVLVLCGIFVAGYLRNSGAYPSGADIFGHLFKSDLLYQSIKKGDYFPLYTDLWYNGMQPFRYWAPLPYYVLAGLEFFTNGDVMESYLLYVIFSIVVGGFGWILWARIYNRAFFCTFLGVLWFFMPDNIRVFFVEGNLPRMTIAILLPYLFYFIWRYVDCWNRKYAISIIITMAGITLCHAMIAAMTGITTFIFLFAYSIVQRRWQESLQVIFILLLSFAICGFWLYPALHGGLVSMNPESTAEVMKALSTSFLVSLNPVLRNHGQYELFYYGTSILIISMIGLMMANRKSRPGFYTAVIVFIGTTPTMVPFLEKLPLNQLFWMTRFTPIAYAVFLVAILEWKRCRRYVLILVGVLLILDCIPSLDLQRYHSQTPSEFYYTLQDAKTETSQRLSLLDLSSYGSYPSFGVATESPAKAYTFGWAWQGATTAHNIVMVNSALEKGKYYYMFDRSLELGDDMVMVRKDLVTKAKKTLADLSVAAEASGYKLFEETNHTYNFKITTPKTFGVRTSYEGLVIGSSADSIALEYPALEEGTSDSLTDYKLADLKKYNIIYLSGFHYDDKAEAEQLVRSVADAGVKVVIDMNRIPVDTLTSRMSFLGVAAQSISFEHQYPELMYQGEIYDSKPFKDQDQSWNTVYLEHVDQILGYSWFRNKQLTFLGSAVDDNIYFLGYNIFYHALDAEDENMVNLMSMILGTEPNQLPLREIVPLKISVKDESITIDSPGGVVNTTLAYQDVFISNQKIEELNNQLFVTEKKTEIHMVYPFLRNGLLISILGLIGLGIFLRIINKEKRYRT